MSQIASNLRSISLDHGIVYVIRVCLDADPDRVAELQSVVTAEELERAGRFIHERDQRRHIIGRGILRLALAQLVGERPERLRFRATDLGKPFMHDGPSFSISHSGNEILVAIARAGRLGVDVEEVRTLKDLLSLARVSFTYAELDSVAALPEEARVRAFFRIWTRKEAMLKALGCGLSGLDGVAVSGDAGDGNALIRMDDPQELDRWTVRSIPIHPHVESAFAWDMPVLEVRQIHT